VGSSRVIFSRIRSAYLVTLLLLVSAATGASQDLSASLPLDPAIRAGTLSNGLTYFIRQNGRPEKRAMLRLAVKAGSMDEEEDQRGLAHMLEHMAFNGSTHFKPGELVSYLESIGARFGPHVNAYTSFDETVYMLDVPTDRQGTLTRGFEALSDFAGGMSLDTDEIDRERGVVIEEWRGRLGAGTRMQEPQLKALFGDSRYVNRIPIGTPEVLKGFSPERLRQFYRDHYRPGRMAVIVVGDIDPAEIEGLIKQYFSGLQPGGSSRTVYPIPDHADTRYVSVSDVEAQGSSISVTHKGPLLALRTAGDYRRTLVRSLMHQMLNARFAEIARRADAPFLRASSDDETLGLTIEAVSVSARVNDGAVENGLRALGEEIVRVRQHGFGEAELDRAKRSALASYERAYNERGTTESSGYASELLRHYLSEEAAPGIAIELDLVRQFLPTITAQEIETMARELFADKSRVVISTAPEKTGLVAVTEPALRDALSAGMSATVTAWRDEMGGRELVPKKPQPGKVVSRREIAEIGVTVLTLSNGVEVWLKPTDFRNDQILFSSYARGGLSLVGADDYLNASLATSLVGTAGVGGFTPVDLGKLLAGRLGGASAYMSSYSQGINGSSTPKDLETALQLTYLHFTAPNASPEAFQLMKRRLEASLANQGQSPGAVYGERVRRINTLDHYSSHALRLEDLPRLDPEKMLSFYKQIFANAANFTFFFVGTFTVDGVTPLIEQYLGSLPSKGSQDSRNGDMHLEFPTSVVRETVAKGQEPRSQTVITFFADTGLDELETHRLQAATEVLEMRLRDILREQLGGTYSVGVNYSNTSPQPGYGVTSVQFGSSPENVESLTAAVMKEIDRLRREGPSAEDVTAVKEAEKNDLQTAVRQNGYWLNSLQAMHLLGRDPRRILQRTERAESLTPENVHAALRKYFPSDRHTEVTLMPETKSQQPLQ
jgi:zinc protease